MTQVNNPFTKNIFPDGEETNALKSRFAVALLRFPDEPFKAGLEVFGSDAGKALFASQNWITDDYVIQQQTALLKTKGARSFLPSKEDYAREVWKLAMNERTPTEDKRALLSLYGDIMGFKTQAEKGGANININNAGRVMIVKDHGSDTDWERAAIAQQAKLATAANAIDVPSRTIN